MYKVFPNYIFRTPVLSIRELNELTKNENLLSSLSYLIQKAIYLASPILLHYSPVVGQKLIRIYLGLVNLNHQKIVTA